MTTLLAIFLTVAALSLAREVFIPFALALLLSFLLAPLVNRLRRWLGRVAAVIVTVCLAGAVLLYVGWFVSQQFYDLASKLPDYQQTIQRKIKALQGSGDSPLSLAFKMLKETERNLTPPEEEEAPDVPVNPSGPADEPEEKPVPVEIKEPEPSPLKIVPSLLGSLLHPLATAGIVIVFVIFMLIHMEDLRDRFLRLVGTSHMHLTTDALNDAAYRVSRYLLMNLVVNVTYGVPIGIGLAVIGVPNALLWGFLATVLRFVPYLGPVVSAVLPIALAFAVDQGWTMFFSTVALFIVIELISNNVVEPWLYGSSTGISPVAVIAGAVFWTWLWGPVGLLLATPLTVCLVVIGRYFPQLQAFNILFGEEPVLTPPVRFYQRLLARDSEGVVEMAELFLKDKPLIELYETVMVPALVLAVHDIHQGILSSERQRLIWETVGELIEEMEDHEDVDSEEEGLPGKSPAPITPPGAQTSVYFIPARHEADEMVGRMLAQLAQRRGLGAQAMTIGTLASEYLGHIQRDKIGLICITSLPPVAFRQVRYLAKRLRNTLPQLKILMHLWQTAGSDSSGLRERLALLPSDLLSNSLPDTLEKVISMVRTSTPQANPPPASAAPSQPPLHPANSLVS